MTTPLERARQLLALATDAGASDAEQRTAAHTLAKLLRTYKLLEVPAPQADLPDAQSVGRWSGPFGEWSVYAAKAYLYCQGCGGNVNREELFFTHPRIGVRCGKCLRVHVGSGPGQGPSARRAAPRR